MSEQQRKRILWIDAAKSFGILAVYIGHFGEDAGMLYPFVFQFHLPLFFFLSGCVQVLNRKSFTENLKLSVMRLLIPFWFFGLVYLAILVISVNSAADLGQNLLTLALGAPRNRFPAGSLWFLTCLWVMDIVFSLIRNWKPVWLGLLALAIQIITVKVLNPSPLNDPKLWYNADSAFSYFVYYLLGFLLMKPLCALLESEKHGAVIGRHAAGLLCTGYACFVFLTRSEFVGRLYWSLPGYDLFGTPLHALCLIGAVIYLSWCLHGLEILQRVGRDTLYLCGNENLLRLAVPILLQTFGLEIRTVSPLSVCIYSLCLIFLARRTVIPLERRILEFRDPGTGKKKNDR